MLFLSSLVRSSTLPLSWAPSRWASVSSSSCNSGLLQLLIWLSDGATLVSFLFPEATSSWTESRLISASLSLVADIVCRLWRFYGTNVYWLQMATDDDIDWTFHHIATIGFRVVRTWAFNDVPSKPSSGTYFQVLFNRIFFFSSLSNLRGRFYRMAKQLLTPGRMVFSALTKWLRRPASMGSSFCSRLPTTGTLRGHCKAPPGTVVIMVASFLEAFSPMTMVRSVIDLAEHYLSYLIYRWHRSLCSELPSRWHPRFVLHWQQHHQRFQKLRCSSGSAVRQQPDGFRMGIRKWLALLIDLPSVFELQSANHYQMGRRNLLVTSVGDIYSNRFYVEILCIIASYIKTLDSNHLVTAGYFDFLDICDQIVDILLWILVMAVSIA